MWLLKYYRTYQKNASILSSQFFSSTSCTHGSGGLFSVSFSYSCCIKQPQTLWLKTTQIYLTVLKVRVWNGSYELKSRCPQGCVLFLEALGENISFLFHLLETALTPLFMIPSSTFKAHDFSLYSVVTSPLSDLDLHASLLSGLLWCLLRQHIY